MSKEQKYKCNSCIQWKPIRLMVKNSKIGINPTQCKNCKNNKAKSKDIIQYRKGLYYNSKGLIVRADPYGVGIKKNR